MKGKALVGAECLGDDAAAGGSNVRSERGRAGNVEMKMDVTEAKVPPKHGFGHLLPFYPEAITLLSF